MAKEKKEIQVSNLISVLPASTEDVGDIEMHPEGAAEKVCYIQTFYL